MIVLTTFCVDAAAGFFVQFDTELGDIELMQVVAIKGTWEVKIFEDTKGAKVIVSCTYENKFLETHPGESDLIKSYVCVNRCLLVECGMRRAGDGHVRSQTRRLRLQQHAGLFRWHK